MTEKNHRQYLAFNKNIHIIGFGSIGTAILPLIFRHLTIQPHQVKIITKQAACTEIIETYGVACTLMELTKENYHAYLAPLLQTGDFLLNLSVNGASGDLIKLCQQKGVLYLDTCIEPWEGGYVDCALSPAERSNYVLRDAALKLRTTQSAPTAVLTHGANPGLVSYFVKQALLNIAHDLNHTITPPNTREQWAILANQLNIKSIHVAERDTQVSNQPKKPGEFVNTWSIDGFISEGEQPAELGWGSH